MEFKLHILNMLRITACIDYIIYDMVRVQSHLTKYVKIGQIGFHTVQFDKTKIDSQKIAVT